MKEWGYPCEVMAPPGTNLGSVRGLVRGEGIDAEVVSFDAALKRPTVLLVLLDTTADDSATSKLRSYLTGGGWLVVSGGSQLVTKIASLSVQGRRPLSQHWSFALRESLTEGRFLVAHPLVAGYEARDWFRVLSLSGEVDVAKAGPGLWLIAFRNPSCPALRVMPLGKGGIVEINWQVYDTPRLDQIESKQILHNAVAWLAEKQRWLPPERVLSQKVSGKVTDDEGVPIAEAEVTARVFADWGAPVDELTSRTDGDGGFTFAAMAPGVYWFEVSAKGFAQEDPFVMSRCEEGREPKPEVIVMRRTVALSGAVYYEGRENAPAPEFPVTLFATDRDPNIQPQKTVTNQHGRFAFEKAPHGKTVALVSEKEDWAGWHVAELPLDFEKEPEEVAIALERVPLVYGRVVEHETSLPIPGARVEITQNWYRPTLTLFSENVLRTQKSDAENGFSLRLLPGTWQLDGEAKEYKHAFGHDEHGRLKDLGRIWLTVASGKTDPECPLVLELEKAKRRSTQFYGTVYLPSGKPAAGAIVECGYGTVCRAESDGKYETEPVYPSPIGTTDPVKKHRFLFEVRLGNLVGCDSLAFENPPERCEHDLWLEEGEPAKGFVRDAKGNPVAGARVTALATHTFTDQYVLEKTDPVFSAADGSFTLEGAVPRSGRQDMWRLELRAEKMVETGDEAGKYVGTASIHLPEKDPIEGFEIVVIRTGEVKGTLSYQDGTPIRNESCRVALQYPSGRDAHGLCHIQGCLGERGEFTLTVSGFHQTINLRAREEGRENWIDPPTPPPNICQLFVDKGGGTEGSTAAASLYLIIDGVKVGDTELDVRLPPLGSIRGRAVDGETGLPLEQFNAGTHPSDQAEKWGIGCWTHGAGLSGDASMGGRFHLGDLPVAWYPSYEVTLRAEGYCERELRELPVKGNETTDLGDIPLYRNWWVRGRVISADTGQPIAATITGPRDATTTTDEQGYFVLTMHRETTGCMVDVVPADNTWQKTRVGANRMGQPSADVGDVLLQRASPE